MDGGSFAPLVQFEKREIHTVFLRFSNFPSKQNLSPPPLADLIRGSFIADFYCFKAKLVIELDGGGHYEPEQQKLDAFRTKIIESYGLKVIRFCNLDIDNNFYGVCTVIDNEVKRRMN